MQASSSSPSPAALANATGNDSSPPPHHQPPSWSQSRQQRQPSQQPHGNNNGRSPPRRPPILLAPITADMSVDREVNLALSELKLSHADILDADFISGLFGSRTESSSTNGSFDSSTAASPSVGNINLGGAGGGGSPPLKKGVAPPLAAPGKTLAGGRLKNATAGVGGGGGGGGGRTSPHTVSTRSMTIANSSVAVDRAATTSSSSSAPAVGGVSISPVISVDHHSESSSLTDDVGSDSWQLINGNAASGGRSGGGSNIFKDAERMGSTFHKSKKIVRPGECVANPRGGGVGGGGTSVPAHPSTPASSARDCVPRFKDGPGATDATPRLSGSHRQTNEPSHHRLEGSSTSPPTPQHCPASPADTVNSVGNSTFHRTSPSLPPSKTTALASLREDRLPPRCRRLRRHLPPLTKMAVMGGIRSP